MKTKHRKGKLEFNKTTVANLDIREIKRVQGGNTKEQSACQCQGTRPVICTAHELSDVYICPTDICPTEPPLCP